MRLFKLIVNMFIRTPKHKAIAQAPIKDQAYEIHRNKGGYCLFS
ncbi:hypothetical protein [Anaerobacillus arseniciselenatis]|nr:hypothetical protein [Anaerobacillus arseniciselenatis]